VAGGIFGLRDAAVAVEIKLAEALIEGVPGLLLRDESVAVDVDLREGGRAVDVGLGLFVGLLRLGRAVLLGLAARARLLGEGRCCGGCGEEGEGRA
jgi:hypothetical protein